MRLRDLLHTALPSSRKSFVQSVFDYLAKSPRIDLGTLGTRFVEVVSVGIEKGLVGDAVRVGYFLRPHPTDVDVKRLLRAGRRSGRASQDDDDDYMFIN